MASPVRVYCRLAFGLTWGIGGIGLLTGLTTSSPLYYLAAYAVSITGIALTAWYDGREGLRRLVLRLRPRISEVHWYVAVILGYAAITVVTRPSLHGLAGIILRDPGPIGEEFGWRGFALPHLLQRCSPLKATILLGILHTFWHLPLFFIPGMPQQQLSFPMLALGVLSMAIFDTALFLRAESNLFLAILVHLMSNVCGTLLGPALFPYFAFAQTAVAGAILLMRALR